MTQAQKRAADLLTGDERYRYEERLGIFGVYQGQEPTETQAEIALSQANLAPIVEAGKGK